MGKKKYFSSISPIRMTKYNGLEIKQSPWTERLTVLYMSTPDEAEAESVDARRLPCTQSGNTAKWEIWKG